MSHDRHIPLIGELAGPDRCVTRQQLLAADIHRDTINSLRRRKFLVDVFAGVYVVGPPELSAREFLRACVLHAGPAAYPSHRSGLELRGVLDVTFGKATVTTKRQNVQSPVWTRAPLTNGKPGILHVRQSTPLLPLPLEWVEGFETPLVPRTMVDFAGMEGAWPLRKAWREATFKSLLDPPAIERQLTEHRRPGNPLVRERMTNAYPVTRPGMDIRSRTGELRFLELVRELGLPEPLVNHRMEIRGRRYRLDFYWEDVRLAIETDGGQHDLDEQKVDDAVRRMDFFIAGIDVLNVPNRTLDSDWAWCRASVLEAYERQRRRAA